MASDIFAGCQKLADATRTSFFNVTDGHKLKVRETQNTFLFISCNNIFQINYQTTPVATKEYPTNRKVAATAKLEQAQRCQAQCQAQAAAQQVNLSVDTWQP